MLEESDAPRVPLRMEPLLEHVLRDQAAEHRVLRALELDEKELGILLRALIRQRAREQWERTS